jgi:predicted N-acetyltransferase YhbS
VNIRRASVGDAQQIATLCEELGYAATAAVLAERLQAFAKASTDFIAVAENGGEISGWIQAHSCHVLESGFRAEIVGLIVSNSARRQGIGRQLVAAAEEWARQIGAPAIVVRSNVARAESHAFYPALGYAETKTQRVYRKTLR